jgi:hypothetical protein
MLSVHHRAGLEVSATALECVLRAAAPFSALQEHICELYGLLERQLGAQDGAPQPDADVCELVLPHYERAKRWREALALPHVQPSAECFSRAIERECNLEAWLRIAETRSDARGARDGANGARDGANGAHENARRAERRTAAIARWREHVLVGAPDASACGREALRAALRSVLQLEALSPSSEGTQQERLEDQLLKTLLKGTPTTAPIGTRATPAASSDVASRAPATAPATTMPTAEARAMVAALPRGVASKIAYHQLGREALERAAALVRRAQGEIEIGRAQGEIEIGRAQGEASGSGGGGGIGGVGKARALGTARRLDGGAYSALVRG